MFNDILRLPDFASVTTDDYGFALPRTSAGFAGKHVQVETIASSTSVAVTVSAGLGPALKRVHLRWNGGVPSAARVLGDHWERGYGDMEWRGVVAERVLPWYFLVNDGALTYGYGVKTGANAFCFWRVDQAGISLYLDIRNGGGGVSLGDRVLHAATVTVRRGEPGESPFAAASAFARALCDSPLFPSQPVYGSNNWYYAYGNSSHEEILRDTDLLVDLAPSSPNRPYMTIDDGWQAMSSNHGGCNGGPWTHGNARFPDMPGLASSIAARGARPGIWLRPLAVVDPTPASLLLDTKRWAVPTTDAILDPTIPDNLARVETDIRRLRDWGYELIKHDFTSYDLLGRWGFAFGSELTNSGWHFADRSRTTAEIVLDLYRAIRRGAAESILIGCNTFGHLAAGLVELQRTGDDTSGQEWERTRKMGVNTLAFRMPQHGAFFAVDADCVGITNDVPWELNRQWLDVLGRSGTPLFVSPDPKAIGPAQASAIRAAFDAASRHQPLAEPLDWMATTCPADWKVGGDTVRYDWWADGGVEL